MKKLLALLLVVVMSFCLMTACGNDDNTETTGSTTEATDNVEGTGTPTEETAEPTEEVVSGGDIVPDLPASDGSLETIDYSTLPASDGDLEDGE
ncbi:MAG: hypothetical protein E7459_05520 [Ruminococcaceae bacterium]|nr:hypothetical protein [Oscillospiraceae bacterium]